MSAEANLATARRFGDAIARGDYDAAAAELAPDFEVEDTDIPESTRTDSFHEWMERWDESWESWRIEDVEIRAVGEERTISLFRVIAKGKGSGIELARNDASIADHRDGKIARIAYYNDQAQALAAAGVSG
jgi:ketosteroid isomerase-like protein